MGREMGVACWREVRGGMEEERTLVRTGRIPSSERRCAALVLIVVNAGNGFGPLGL